MKISVVTPSYNQAQFLDETIKSVLDQRYADLEYVIIDGGSTDGSQEIIKMHQKHLHYWISEPDKGHGDALNKGFEKTSGEIMTWLNSDDKYMPWTFEVVSEIFSSFPHVNWIVGTPGLWDSKGRLTKAPIAQKNIYDFLLGRFEWIQQESVFWRRSLWDKAGAGIDTSYEYMVDGDLWSRYFLYDSLYHVRCVIGGYRLHKVNRAVLNYNECLGEMRRAIRTMKPKCNKRVLRISKIIRCMYPFGIFFDTRLANIIFCALFPIVLNNARYNVIRYNGEKWVEGHSEFQPFDTYVRKRLL